MSDGQFQTFMTGGLGLLVAAALAITWLLWRDRDARAHCAVEMLSGVSHEYRLNLHQMLSELSALSAGSTLGPSALLPITHPQMDGVNRSQVEANRRALAVMGASYQELGARKMELRAALSKGDKTEDRLEEAVDACIDGMATLYLWDEHCGAAPNEARATRSWAVRDWMKLHGFGRFAFPEMHFRDEVVERLRLYGMDLSPKPLTHSAAEYYAMRYDRQADPRGVFGKRRFKEEELNEIEDFVDELEADELEADELEAIKDTAADEALIASEEPIEELIDSVVDEASEDAAELVDDIIRGSPVS